MNIAGNSASVEGLVPLTAGAAGADLEVAAEGPDLAALGGLFTDAGGIPALPYALAGVLRIEKQSYRLGDFTGTLGNTELAGDGLLVVADNFAGSRFDVRAKGPALEELVPTLDEFGVKEGPFDLQADISFTGDRVELRGASLERPNARLD
ncbi:MAG: AsmA-like C-terminal region-containing protein, partial [Desulfuromonadales bacterium]|nr:AsmA-like C-terminal region-containing protein [Desulfuromonadales bacterium]